MRRHCVRTSRTSQLFVQPVERLRREFFLIFCCKYECELPVPENKLIVSISSCDVIITTSNFKSEHKFAFNKLFNTASTEVHFSFSCEFLTRILSSILINFFFVCSNKITQKSRCRLLSNHLHLHETHQILDLFARACV